MLKHSKWLLVLMMALVLGGCLSPVKTASITRYTFDPVQPKPGARMGSGILLVSTPTAAPGYSENKIAYQQKRGELKYFSRSRWVAPPAKLLQPLLVEQIQNSGGFRAVVAAPYAGLSDYRLDTRLLFLFEDFVGGKPTIHMGVRARLIKSARSRVVATRTFIVSEPIVDDDIYLAVRAANTAVTEIVLKVSTFALKK